MSSYQKTSQPRANGTPGETTGLKARRSPMDYRVRKLRQSFFCLFFSSREMASSNTQGTHPSQIIVKWQRRAKDCSTIHYTRNTPLTNHNQLAESGQVSNLTQSLNLHCASHCQPPAVIIIIISNCHCRHHHVLRADRRRTDSTLDISQASGSTCCQSGLVLLAPSLPQLLLQSGASHLQPS